ncbi:MAG: hypothetical protein OER88_14920, partial [Planctomycetota bacterium]|nr:hypothetical protein [Planctomycetota bacterium]
MLLTLLLCVPQVSDAYGQWAGFCEDVDGDGLSDIVVGDESGEPWKEYVYSGVTGDLVRTLREPRHVRASRGFEADLDGDGVDDLLFTDPAYQRRDLLGRRYTGRVSAVSGKQQSVLWTTVGKGYTSGIGRDAVLAGDVNLDGTPDVLTSTSAAFAGRLLCLSGANGRVLVQTRDDQTGLFPELGDRLDAGKDI